MSQIKYIQKKRDEVEKEWQLQNTKEKKEERASRVPVRKPSEDPPSPPPAPREYQAVYVPPSKRGAKPLRERSTQKGQTESSKSKEKSSKEEAPSASASSQPVGVAPAQNAAAASLEISETHEHERPSEPSKRVIKEAAPVYVPRHRRPVLLQLNVEVSAGQQEVLVVHEGDDVPTIVRRFAARFHMKDSHIAPLIELASTGWQPS